jgi:formamidopyrimidine-DNA glycosylase
MPELPEVESAVRRLRKATVGKTIADASVLHPALERRLSNARLRSVRGATVASVERRGKHQLLRLDDGRVLHAHFRMTGDWTMDRASAPLPRFARAYVAFDNGARVVLDDPRALSTLDLHAKNDEPDLGLGPEPSDSALTAEYLLGAFAKRRGPIKPVLLDQRVIAGLGNIYAAEALWHSKISPLVLAKDLTKKQVSTLIGAIRKVIKAATGARYTDADVSELAVYDREGQTCRRCGNTIERVVQAGRSTYYCPGCQLGAGRRKAADRSAARRTKER